MPREKVVTMNMPKLNRRQFIRAAAAAAAGALAVPTLLGYGLVHKAKGELPPELSPYAPLEFIEELDQYLYPDENAPYEGLSFS